MGSLAMSLPGMRGLGTLTTSQEINSGLTTAGAGAAAAASAGLLSVIGITAAAVPFIGPIVAGVTLLISALGIGNGCGGTCTEATQVVNQAETLLQQNLAAAQQTVEQYGCLTASEFSQLVQNFNTIWGQVEQQCGAIPAPGGTQCISDRQPGGKLDWTGYYLTPIRSMPVCADAAVAGAGTAGTGISGVVSSLTSNPILLVALAVGALFIFKD